MSSFLLNQISVGIKYFLLNFFTTCGSVLALHVTALMRVSLICWGCLLCLYTYWALSPTSDTSLLYCLSQCCSTGVPRNLSVPWVAARGSART